MAAYIDVQAAITAAKTALKEKDEVMERVSIIRTDLRNSITMKVATPEQVKWIEEHFPMRERETDPQKAIAKAEQRVAEMRKRASRPKVAA